MNSPHIAPQPEPDIWEELTSGKLSSELAAALKLLAEQRDDYALRFEAHAPLSEGFRIRVTDLLAAQVAHESQRRRFARLGVPTFIAGLAAAALLAVVVPGSDVPAYDLSVAGGVAEARGPVNERAQVIFATPESELELVLRPARRVEGHVVLSVYLYSSRGAFPLKKAAERDDSGAFRLLGSVDSLFGAPFGTYTVAATVDRKALSAQDVAAKLHAGNQDVEIAKVEFSSTARGPR